MTISVCMVAHNKNSITWHYALTPLYLQIPNTKVKGKFCLFLSCLFF
jgi:hypothetical protein